MQSSRNHPDPCRRWREPSLHVMGGSDWIAEWGYRIFLLALRKGLYLGGLPCTIAVTMTEQESDPRHQTEPSLFMQALSLVGPAPEDTPATLRLKPGQTVVAIGDSITAYGNFNGYLTMWDTFLAQHCPDLDIPKIINAGIGGQTSEDLVARFQSDVVDKKPDLVTISVGINDVWSRLGASHDEAVLAAYKQNVTTMVDMAQAAGIEVILLSPTIIVEDVDSDGNRRLAMYVEAEKQIAQAKNCAVVDLHRMFLTALQKKPSGEEATWLTTDGVHMKPLGYAIMAIGLLRGMGVSDAMLAAHSG